MSLVRLFGRYSGNSEIEAIAVDAESGPTGSVRKVLIHAMTGVMA
jgi:hypothetical protein